MTLCFRRWSLPLWVMAARGCWNLTEKSQQIESIMVSFLSQICPTCLWLRLFLLSCSAVTAWRRAGRVTWKGTSVSARRRSENPLWQDIRGLSSRGPWKLQPLFFSSAWDTLTVYHLTSLHVIPSLPGARLGDRYPGGSKIKPPEVATRWSPPGSVFLCDLPVTAFRQPPGGRISEDSSEQLESKQTPGSLISLQPLPTPVESCVWAWRGITHDEACHAVQSDLFHSSTLYIISTSSLNVNMTDCTQIVHRTLVPAQCSAIVTYCLLAAHCYHHLMSPTTLTWIQV